MAKKSHYQQCMEATAEKAKRGPITPEENSRQFHAELARTTRLAILEPEGTAAIARRVPGGPSAITSPDVVAETTFAAIDTLVERQKLGSETAKAELHTLATALRLKISLIKFKWQSDDREHRS